MNEIPQWLFSLLSAIAGGLLVGLINWRINKTNKEFEEKRHLRELKSLEERQFKELIFKAATDARAQDANIALEESKRGRQCNILPMGSHLLYFIKLSEALLSDKLTRDNIAQKLKEVHDFTKEAQKEIDKYSKS